MRLMRTPQNYSLIRPIINAFIANRDSSQLTWLNLLLFLALPTSINVQPRSKGGTSRRKFHHVWRYLSRLQCRIKTWQRHATVEMLKNFSYTCFRASLVMGSDKTMSISEQEMVFIHLLRITPVEGASMSSASQGLARHYLRTELRDR